MQALEKTPNDAPVRASSFILKCASMYIDTYNVTEERQPSRNNS